MRLSSLRTALVVAAAIACGFIASFAYAETWSDKSGKFRIEAKFAGVQERSVLLKKPDGKTITVPINRLSDASRQQAKRLFEAQRATGGAAPAANVPATRAAYAPPENEPEFHGTGSAACRTDADVPSQPIAAGDG